MKPIFTTSKKQPSGLHFTTNHGGKMAGLHSISTSVWDNARCSHNANIKGSICSVCFASRQMAHFPGMHEAMSANGKILNNTILSLDVLPLINAPLFRFQAFGDLASEIEVINYFNIARKNPDIRCALWTKNPDYIQRAMDMGYKKPKNLQIIYSSLFINRVNIPHFDFIDKVFTCYDNEGAKDVNINCGARSCFLCGRCYRKNPKGVKIELINELVK